MSTSQPVQLQTFEQFRQWLTVRGVDLSCWGEGMAKSAEALWREVEQGETRLLDNPVRRVVESVVVIVRRGERILVETEQQLPDGRWRSRNWPPSEKIKQGEDHLAAAVRGLQEELHLPAAHIDINPQSYRLIERKRDSVSYPTLLAVYRIHMIEAVIEVLPEKSFFTEEVSRHPSSGKKIHYWEWLVPTGELELFA